MLFNCSTFLPGGAIWRALVLTSLLAAMPNFKALGAQTAVPTLSLPQALQQALLNNPDLQNYPYRLRINEARALQASIRPVPVLEVEAENAFARTSGRRMEKPFAESEITLALSTVIELGDKRSRRMEQVRASAETLYTDYELNRLEILAETTRRYYAVLRLQQLQGWLENRIDLEREALEIAQRRANAGALAQAEVSRLRLRLARSETLQLDQEGQLAVARLELSAMWASAEPVSFLSGELAALPAVPSNQKLRQAVENTPAFLHQASALRLAAADLRLQQSHNRADPSVSIGVRHSDSENDTSLVASLGIPLGQARSNRGRVMAAQAELDLQESQQSLITTRMMAVLIRIRQQMANNHVMATRLQQHLLPLARQLLDDIHLGYAEGLFDVIQWLDAQSELVELERELIEARYSAHLQLLELEQLTGQALADNAMSMLSASSGQEVSP